MKSLLFAAALSVSSLALAQATTQSSTTQPTTQDTTEPAAQDPAQPTTRDPAQPTTQDPAQPTMQDPAQPSGQTVNDPSQSTGPQGVTQQGTDPNGQATAPAGANQGVTVGVSSVNQSAPFTPRPAAGEYPPCSRTVTDNCIQTYERGVRASRRRR